MGLVTLGVGCSRAPVAPRPTVVYVDAQALARDHPQWRTVAALDRQIAWLSAYRVAPARSPGALAVDTSVPPSDAVEIDLAALNRRIETTLETVRTSERRILETELERERRQVQASDILARRKRIELEAERRFQAVLDRRGEEMANLAVRETALKLLERSYAARGAAWQELAAQMRERLAAVKAEYQNAEEQRYTEVVAVFNWLETQFAEAASQEKVNAEEWRLTHGERLEELDRRIDEQMLMLMNALRRVTPPSIAMAARSSQLAPPPSSAGTLGAPSVPPPNLEGRIAALKARRVRLARFIVQNTKAVVKSAARAQKVPMEPVFEPQAHDTPDRTAFFRSAVMAPAREIQGLTEHGDL